MQQQNPLLEPNVHQKIKIIQSQRDAMLGYSNTWKIPKAPGRDLLIVGPESLPPKLGLSYIEGQARLLHDLAAIELQAMELALRSLLEFPEADPQFRDELLIVALDESRHLQLCLDAIEFLGFHWGQWPMHNLLWQAVSSEDSLLDRILIVHRYLEGSGLDAGDTLLRRLSGVKEGIIHTTIQTIVREELGHVNFGSKWYKRLCQNDGRDSDQDFILRFKKLRQQLPKRIEPISIELRTKAGFTAQEVECLAQYRDSIVKFPAKN